MARTVFVLRDMEQIPVELIARILNRSVAAIEVCLMRARLQLREDLAPHMRLPQ
jgi:DNA-directed RNA polymerase specialized sigma24 family protein